MKKIKEISFATYVDYKTYVLDEWENGHINELREDGLIDESEPFIDENGQNARGSRLLAQNEFNEQFYER